MARIVFTKMTFNKGHNEKFEPTHMVNCGNIFH